MDNNIIERRAVNKLQEMLDEINDYCHANIVHDILYGDKTPGTDGFIRVNGKEIAIQVKGRKKQTDNMQIAKKYWKYAEENLLLFIMIDDLKERKNSNIYYEFLSREKLEKSLKGRRAQKTIKNTFKKQLNNVTHKEFIREFIEEFDKRDEKKSVKFEDIITSGNLKVKVKINDGDSFNEGHSIKIQSFTDSDTGLTYKIKDNPNIISRIFALEEGQEIFEFEDIKIAFKKKVDHVTKNILLSDNHFEYTLFNNRETISIKFTPPRYVNDINIESLKFNKKLLDELVGDLNSVEYNSTLNMLSKYEEYNKMKEIIGSVVKIPLDSVDEVYNAITSCEPLNEYGHIKYFIEDTTIDFYWDEKLYQVITQDWCNVMISEEETRRVNIPYYFIFLFQGVINPKSVAQKLSFYQYDLSDKDIINYLNTLISLNFDEQVQKFSIMSLCYNILLYLDENLITSNLCTEIIQIGEDKSDDDIKIIGLTLKVIKIQLTFSEKRYIYGVIDSLQSKIITYLAYYLVGELNEDCIEFDELSNVQHKIINQLKEVINAKD